MAGDWCALYVKGLIDNNEIHYSEYSVVFLLAIIV